MARRNTDIGLNGRITPFLVPGIEECQEAAPSSYPRLGAEVVSKYGFEMDFKIRPDFPGRRELLKISYPSGEGEFIYPEKHFPAIMREVIKKLREKYGQECCAD